VNMIQKVILKLRVLTHEPSIKIIEALDSGEMTGKDLEFVTGMPQSTVSRYVNELVDYGYVECHTGDKDARWKYFQLTGEVERVFGSVRNLMNYKNQTK